MPFSLGITNFWSGSIVNNQERLKLKLELKQLRLEFDEIPVSSGLNDKIPTADLEALRKELNKLLEKDGIVVCDHEIDEFMSPIFLREKLMG